MPLAMVGWSMTDHRTEAGRLAPIFILADDDRDACDRIISTLRANGFFIPVSDPHLVVRYAEQFATTAVFLADQMHYPEGGAARLLQSLLDRVGKPVVILAEDWDQEVVARWKRMGAMDCIPHPTRTGVRFERLRATIQDLSLKAVCGTADSQAG